LAATGSHFTAYVNLLPWKLRLLLVMEGAGCARKAKVHEKDAGGGAQGDRHN